MNNRTPRLATLALMLAALTACTKTNISPNDDLSNGLNPSSGAPIAFESQDAFTKADDNTDPAAFMAVRAGGFKVWSWFQGTTAGPMFGENGTVVTDDNYVADLEEGQTMPDPNWTYSPTRYWLNGTYDFAAVYPATVSGITYEPASEGGAPVLNIPAFDVKGKDDLLVAFNNNINGSSRNNPVSLNFQHKLTKVNFRISQSQNDADNDYYISTVVISGVKNKRPYTALPVLDENGNISSLTEIWEESSEEESISFEKVFNPPIRLKNPSLQNPFVDLTVWTDEDPLLLIPQHLDGSTMKLRVEYIYDMAGDEDGNGMSTFIEKAIPATNPDDELWQPGRHITYTITLAQQTEIKFGIPTIEPWSQPLTGDTVIIPQ